MLPKEQSRAAAGRKTAWTPPLGNPALARVGWGLGMGAVFKGSDASGLEPSVGAATEPCALAQRWETHGWQKPTQKSSL